ncbi:MAG: hypothetical protein MJ177_03410 [Clostridia bacterium]|nr:hypothetical protein [Clostridia bacterium]
MKKISKILAVVLALLMVAGSFAVPVSAAVNPDDTFEGYATGEKIENGLNRFLDKLIYGLVKIVNFFMPGINWTGKWAKIKNYEPVEFYEGEQAFSCAVADGARWSMGYARASLLDGLDIYDGTYYMAGTLEAFKGRVPTGVVDDQGVTTYAVSDGSGTVVHAVIDGYGLTRGDVQEIRARLTNFAMANNIISINVSVLHQHSCIDILGMGVPLVPAILENPTLTILDKEVVGGKTEKFMKNLYAVTAQSVIDAVNDMETGSLYFGSVDASQYIHDKRDPDIIDGNISRLRFVPDDETSSEIWVCEAGIHCVGLGAGTDRISGDFPYYIKEYVKAETGADLVWVQGAELAITADYTNVKVDPEDTNENARIKAMGYTLGALICTIDNDEQLDPVLNIKHSEVVVKADGQVLILAVREGLINSVVAKDGLGYVIISELGYMELGNKVGIFLTPGEIAPEIFFGGVACKERSWTGTTWDYVPLAENSGMENVIVFGLCNDQIGYILPDNDYRSILTQNEEINAASSTAGSTVTEGFEALLASVK